MGDCPDVGSWNIYRDNADGLPGIKRGILKMIDRGADVVCLQEISRDDWWLEIRGWMQGRGWVTDLPNMAIATYVNAAKYDVRGWKNTVVFDPKIEGTISVEKSGANDTLGYKSFTEVVVQRKGTQDFTAILNNHLVPTIEKDGELANPLRLDYAKRQLEAVAERARYFIGEGIPTVVCADWNISTSTDAGHELQQWLAEYGLGSAQAIARGGPFDTHGDREIDDQYSGGPIVVGTMWRLGTGNERGYTKDGSDHNQIVVNYDKKEADMASWTLAPTLIELRDEINENWPLRDKTSDGSLGNAAHSATVSDHNPNSKRVVCAIDVDEDLGGSKNTVYPRFNSGTPAKQVLLDVLLDLAKAGKLPQLNYLIYERKIYQRKNKFEARTYSGVNAHDHHLHVSVMQTESLWNRKTSWGITKAVPKFLPVYVVDPEKVTTNLIANAPDGKDDIKRAPGFRVTTGVEIDGKWLVTQSGYRYHTDYMVLESVLKARLVVTPAPAGFVTGVYHTTAEKTSAHEKPDADSKVVGTWGPNTDVQVGKWMGEADGHRWVADTMSRYWNFDVLAAGPAKREPKTHTVKSGDTLYAIARNNNLSLAELQALNPKVSAPALQVGTVLRLEK